MKVFWHLFGWTNVTAGTAGVFLPLLPTRPFLLLPDWALGLQVLVLTGVGAYLVTRPEAATA